MNRETGNVLLVLLGGALLKIAYNGSYLRYVKPSLLPFLVAAGAVIAALGAVAIVRDLRAGRRERQVSRDPEEHAGHGGGSSWLLLLPVLAILLVAPPALGADQVNRTTPVSPPTAGIRFGPLPPGEAPSMPIWEFVSRAVWDDSGTLDGRDVTLTGFAVRAPDGSVQLARMRIACCAADAAPGRIRLDGVHGTADQVGALQQDEWYQVRGHLQPGSGGPDDEFVPALDVTSVRPVPAPTEPYES